MARVGFDNHESICRGESLLDIMSESFLEGTRYELEENTSSTACVFKSVFKRDIAYMENTITLLNSPKRAQNEKFLKKRVKSFPLITAVSLMPEEYENADLTLLEDKNGIHSPLELSALIQSPSIASLRGEFKRNINNKAICAEKELSSPPKYPKTSTYRRKSDCSYCHGGISLLELKIVHVAVDYLKRNEPDDLSWLTSRLIPSQSMKEGKVPQVKPSTRIIDRYSEGTLISFGKDSRTMRPICPSKNDNTEENSLKIQKSLELGGWKRQKINIKTTDTIYEQALVFPKRSSILDSSPLPQLETFDVNMVDNQLSEEEHTKVDSETSHFQPSINTKSSPKSKIKTHHAYVLSRQIAKTNVKSEILMQKLQSIITARHNLAPSTPKTFIPQDFPVKKNLLGTQNKDLKPKPIFSTENDYIMPKKSPHRPTHEILVTKSSTSPNRLRIKQIYRKSNVPEIPQTVDHLKIKSETPCKSRSIRRLRTVEDTAYLGLSFENRIILQPSSQRCTKTRSDQNFRSLCSKAVIQNSDNLNYFSQSTDIDLKSLDSPKLSDKRSKWMGLKKQSMNEQTKSNYSVYSTKPIQLRLPKLKEGLKTQSLFY